MNPPKLAFLTDPIRLPLDGLFPTRKIRDETRITRYATILASIKEVGVIEPLSVFPQKGKFGNYLILDGHLRHLALKELGQTEADCLVSTEDEAFTYNNRISRVCAIQEHRMIVKAVHNGVSPERIANALNKPLHQVNAMINLLTGIHEDAAELLKDKPIAALAICAMKRVVPERQIEMAEIMVSLSNYTQSYAEALVFGTPKEQLLRPDEPRTKKGLTAEQISRMEAENEALERDFRAVERGYGENNLNLTVARTYIRKLLENTKVTRFLSSRYPDLLPELEAIGAMEVI